MRWQRQSLVDLYIQKFQSSQVQMRCTNPSLRCCRPVRMKQSEAKTSQRVIKEYQKNSARSSRIYASQMVTLRASWNYNNHWAGPSKISAVQHLLLEVAWLHPKLHYHQMTTSQWLAELQFQKDPLLEESDKCNSIQRINTRESIYYCQNSIQLRYFT